MYKDNWIQPWPRGLEIYPEVHENPRALFSSSSPILLEPLAHGSSDWSLPREDCIIFTHTFFWKAVFYATYPHICTFLLKGLLCYISTHIYTHFFERHFHAIYSLTHIYIYTYFERHFHAIYIHTFWKAFSCYLGARHLPWWSKFKC